MQLRLVTTLCVFFRPVRHIIPAALLNSCRRSAAEGATEEQQPKGNLVFPPRDKFGDVSPGAAEDTLKACLARIPEQATVGQRMMAEPTCEREEAGRNLYQGTRWF